MVRTLQAAGSGLGEACRIFVRQGRRRCGHDRCHHQRAAPHQGQIVPHHQAVQEGDQ